jgi:hypothetical protein
VWATGFYAIGGRKRHADCRPQSQANTKASWRSSKAVPAAGRLGLTFAVRPRRRGQLDWSLMHLQASLALVFFKGRDVRQRQILNDAVLQTHLQFLQR